MSANGFRWVTCKACNARLKNRKAGPLGSLATFAEHARKCRAFNAMSEHEQKWVTEHAAPGALEHATKAIAKAKEGAP